MTDSEFIKMLIAFAAGSLLTLMGAWSNHLLSEKRWEAEIRNSEVAYWRDFSDRWFSITMRAAELKSPVPAAELPVEPKEIATRQLRELQELNDLYKSVKQLGLKRAPEPLTDHVRLLLARMERAKDAIPYDIELAKVAIVEFRSALDQYVRRGKSRGVRLFRNESADEYDRVAGRLRIPGPD